MPKTGRPKEKYCKRGHEKTPANTTTLGRCRACRNIGDKKIVTGVGKGGLNKSKTHCPAGHEYTPENTYVYSRDSKMGGQYKSRQCKACVKAKQRSSTPRKKKTHCKYGHLRTPENILFSGGCRVCWNLKRKGVKQRYYPPRKESDVRVDRLMELAQSAIPEGHIQFIERKATA